MHSFYNVLLLLFTTSSALADHQSNTQLLQAGQKAVGLNQQEWGSIKQQAYLKASNTGQDDSFGQAVAISGDTLVVRAYSEDSNAKGVDGDGANDLAGFSGAAYVFRGTNFIFADGFENKD